MCHNTKVPFYGPLPIAVERRRSSANITLKIVTRALVNMSSAMHTTCNLTVWENNNYYCAFLSDRCVPSCDATRSTITRLRVHSLAINRRDVSKIKNEYCRKSTANV